MSIRLRVAAVFTLALAIAFALGSWLLVSQLSSVVLHARRHRPGQLSCQPAASSSAAPAPPTALASFGARRVRRPAHRRLRPGPGSEPGCRPGTAAEPGQQRAARHGPDHADNDRSTAAPERVMARRLAIEAGLDRGRRGVPGIGERHRLGGRHQAGHRRHRHSCSSRRLAPTCWRVPRWRRWSGCAGRPPPCPRPDPSARLPVPRTRDEIAALAGTMNDLLARLHSALARQRSFVADASHELRTPVRGAARASWSWPPSPAAAAKSWPRPSPPPPRRRPGCPGSPTTCCCWRAATRTS